MTPPGGGEYCSVGATELRTAVEKTNQLWTRGWDFRKLQVCHVGVCFAARYARHIATRCGR